MSRVCVANMYSLTWSVLCVEYNIVSRVLCTVAVGGGGEMMLCLLCCIAGRPGCLVKPVLFVNSNTGCALCVQWGGGHTYQTGSVCQQYTFYAKKV